MSVQVINGGSTTMSQAGVHPLPGDKLTLHAARRLEVPDAVVVASGEESVDDAERELDQRGFHTPVQTRAAWRRLLGTTEDCHVLACDAERRYLGMMALGVTRTRALPGHRIVRIESVGDGYATPTGRALLTGATVFAKSHGRVLRVVVELECRDGDKREFVRSVLQDLGYRRSVSPNIAERTLAVDLSGAEEAILSRFRKTTRQSIRSVAKYGLEIELLTSDAYGDRMNELLAASMARTGGEVQPIDWLTVMTLHQALPGRLRIVGIFRGAARTPGALLGFAWALHHGERVEYYSGASARGERGPLLHALMWELICWGKREGGTWFDMGGVTPGSHGTDDPLGGISDFKRGFSREEIALGEEWVYEPGAFKAWLGNATSQAAEWVRQTAR